MSESADTATDSQVNFLLDQVQRLSSQLDHYQKETPSPIQFDSQEEVPVRVGKEASLLLEKRGILAPLLVEYDRVIEELKKHNLFYQNELEILSQKIHELTDENKRLYEELDKALRSQIGDNSQIEDVGNSEETISSELVDNLKQQIAIVTHERDSYLDKWQASQHALLRQQKNSQEQSSRLLELNSRNFTTNEEISVLKQNFTELQNYKETLEMETEKSTGYLKRKAEHLESLQGEFDEAKSQLGMMKLKNTQLEKLIEQVNTKSHNLITTQ
ncbi:Sodium channel and clathrin linker 1 isoform X2 [Oopsacas minuta]|uniref:Sodium channel and clathrin linker 1 isoform X2 n=1 Tax=Oopsacas minuta TaxID=111878 RepID=A0AAV7JTI6_9METZ|nr:Sodium channel and clathrin linker 1 isoform X2 [Oopsacas minuta]